MHELVRREREAPTTCALSVGPSEGAGGWRLLLAAVTDGRTLAVLVTLLVVAVLVVIRAFDDEPWSTTLTPILLAAPYAFVVGLGAVATGLRPKALEPLPALGLVNDEGPSFSQIAGMPCAGCGSKIVVQTEGALCELCGGPCHDPCANGHRADHKRVARVHPYR
jgi:hypothetical protein